MKLLRYLTMFAFMVAPAHAVDVWPADTGGVPTPYRHTYLSTSCLNVPFPCYTDLSDACAAAIQDLPVGQTGMLAIYPGVYYEVPTANDLPAVDCSGGGTNKMLHVSCLSDAHVPGSDSGVVITTSGGSDTFTGNPTVRTSNAVWSGCEITSSNDAGDIALQVRTSSGTGTSLVRLLNMNLYVSSSTVGNVSLDVQGTGVLGSVLAVDDSKLIQNCATCDGTNSVVRVNWDNGGSSVNFNQSYVALTSSVNAESMLFDIQDIGLMSVANSELSPLVGEAFEVDEDTVGSLSVKNVVFNPLTAIGQLIDIDSSTPGALAVYFAGIWGLQATPTAVDDYGSTAVVTWVPQDYPRSDTPPTCSATLEGMRYIDLSLDKTCVCNGSVWEQEMNGVNGTSSSCGTTQSDAGAAPPATCEAGQIFVDTDETVDTNCSTVLDNSICCCIATDTWATCGNV